MRRFVGFGTGHTVSTATEGMPLPILGNLKNSMSSFASNVAGPHKHMWIR